MGKEDSTSYAEMALFEKVEDIQEKECVESKDIQIRKHWMNLMCWYIE